MITTKQMRFLEENCGIPKIELMENAGKGIFEILKKFNLKNKKILVVCFHGNNGGDGFVAARYLRDICKVDIYFIGHENKLKPEAKKNYEKLDKSIFIKSPDFNQYDIIIDAMLGIGIQGKLREPISSTVDKINKSKAFKISIDIPTGLDPDTGKIADKVVNADLIITFHDTKQGLEKLQDKVVIVDIGIKNVQD